jgi:hypothetical protein
MMPQTRPNSLSPLLGPLLGRGEGGGEGHNRASAPHRNPLPVKNGEREQTAFAPLLIT